MGFIVETSPGVSHPRTLLVAVDLQSFSTAASCDEMLHSLTPLGFDLSTASLI